MTGRCWLKAPVSWVLGGCDSVKGLLMEKQSPGGSHWGVSHRLAWGQETAVSLCLLILGVSGLLDQVLGFVPRTYGTWWCVEWRIQGPGTSFDFLDKKKIDFALNSDWLGIVWEGSEGGKIMVLISHEVHSFSELSFRDLLEWTLQTGFWCSEFVENGRNEANCVLTGYSQWRLMGSRTLICGSGWPLGPRKSLKEHLYFQGELSHTL